MSTSGWETVRGELTSTEEVRGRGEGGREEGEGLWLGECELASFLNRTGILSSLSGFSPEFC